MKEITGFFNSLKDSILHFNDTFDIEIHGQKFQEVFQAKVNHLDISSRQKDVFTKACDKFLSNMQNIGGRLDVTGFLDGIDDHARLAFRQIIKGEEVGRDAKDYIDLKNMISDFANILKSSATAAIDEFKEECTPEKNTTPMRPPVKAIAPELEKYLKEGRKT